MPKSGQMSNYTSSPDFQFVNCLFVCVVCRCVCVALVWTDSLGTFCSFKCGHTRSGDVPSRKTLCKKSTVLSIF